THWPATSCGSETSASCTKWTRTTSRSSSCSWAERSAMCSSSEAKNSMDTRVIPLSDLQADLEGMLGRCFDSGQPLVVALPNRGLVAIQPVDSEDDLINDLIEHNSAFRELVARSLAAPREPFPFAVKEGHRSASDELREG